MKFTDAELDAIDRALSIAAGVYDSDAENLRKDNQPGVADQFVKQAAEARAIADRIGSRP